MSVEEGKALYQGKRVLVLGLAKSGAAVARVLKHCGALVTVNDKKPESECEEARDLWAEGIDVICGGHPDDIVNPSVDFVIKNPGIPYSVVPIQKALALGIPVITEVEVAYELSDAPIIGITGSNGKTTTTTLIGRMLEESGLHPVVAGNIGTPLSEQAAQAKAEQTLVAELSSFQLKGTRRFRPSIACLLNVYDAHLDYHKTKEDYVHSKSKLFANQTAEDVAVLNYDSEICRALAADIKAALLWFSTKQEVEQGSFVRGDEIVFKRPQNGRLAQKLSEAPEIEKVLRLDELALPGTHNLENILAGVSVARAAGASIEAIRRVLRTFAGVEHRLEFVAEINGVKYYNDSKATNPEAASRALASFVAPIIWIAGGLDRGIDFKELVPLLKKRVKAVITYGQTAEKLLARAEEAGIIRRKRVDNVTDAVAQARLIAQEGDVVLLSPACASWDMYKSFEERGVLFKQSVHKLKTSL
ncbi:MULTISPECIES: UDP-N-acetylmuramoyl-L-alanine--D-glutamate ligase [Aneurinibacillus]|uniref:UDP-N-acetylmuramoylalanine--D-glutamate ligase n=1 Tax=Aneurinibacillus thermoaerophilus TaxID=143495 RepID=A0ABX8Y8J5_ANETH|nr:MULTISPECIES: UDP-N-acetylmuramoyl-L-alanine--D-glutamate ligase [Aneurinibacillus]AMA72570.1 UDP-N-acetylmuramoylalanine--D-glutamate ligase [Aneurinibacillus sp. XH2]MED0674724.1 UDP-N-acetylmuramoyl-L-alanine--D-glutamate ligase [Aneurinibacillus thermoaerophilus]MED0736844.1 UDP-N-acetylmuramoyl-L-alanine--D-glutamate ligase [Aneurinibacillus thermoaerophilus]QYY41680.1 UDP-N-acetylmuramoyl-L-alanine--D-glutamate ligase [Aneurinibacillus thermoaerophilus]